MEDKAITYVFALDANDTLIHISDSLPNELYKCPGCKSNMLIVKGPVRAHHFRHNKATCSYESYLHNSAKNAFYKAFNNAKIDSQPIKFQLTRLVTCSSLKSTFLENKPSCSSYINANYNLVDLFDLAELEKHDTSTGLTPDVLLTNSNTNKRCYFEVCVTHPCSKNKIESGIPIIEINITREEDIEYIQALDFSIDDSRLTVHNFNVSPLKKDICSSGCHYGSEEFEIWTLSSSGRLNLAVKRFENLTDNDLSACNCWSCKTDKTEKYKMIKQVAFSLDPHNTYQNCLKCLHSDTWSDGQVYCSVKSRQLYYGEAKKCKDYQVGL
tara:strand:+ start:345 stop:1322 length:978 start_codon:yes stop_codon:yes gene_type:complete